VFKADVLNDFIATHRIRSVIDFGCGDGAQLRLAQYPRYLGIDVSAAAVDMCRARFSSDPQKSFYRVGETPTDLSAELALSMDVVYHLVEDDIFDAYMRDLFAAATRYVVIYASNEDEPWRSPHVRHRKFTDWIERNEPAWRVAQHIPNEFPYVPADPHHTTFADFYMFANS
jgi:SAM-dependent methyltransferase